MSSLKVNQKEGVEEKVFDFDVMNEKYEKGLLKDFLDSKLYVAKFFYPLKNGTHALIEDGEITIIQKETMNTVYLPRFPKTVKTWYNTKTTPKKLICDIHKPTIGKDFINVAKRIKHTYQKYETLSEEEKEGVQLVLSYIKEVWANNDEIVFQYVITWFANMVKGNKNKTCLYAKASQGIGKSTLPEFLRDYVLGKDLTCKGKSDHLKGQHNLSLLGRLLVYFEELQIFNDKEWYAVDSELKDMITDDWGSYTDKYEKRFEAENINSYMIVTNSDLKGINGRRYLVLDLSTKRLDDFEYYGNLRKECFNDKIGRAFYCYLMDIETSNFVSLNLPETKNKNELIAELLTPIEKFLKFVFLLREQPIKILVKELHKMYNHYDSKHYMSIQAFCRNMRGLGFDYGPDSAGYNIYDISIEELQELAKRKKWLHALDKDMIEKNDEEECFFIDKAVYVRVEEHKKVFDLANKLSKDIKDIKKYKDEDIYEQAKYIKELEKYIYKLENKIERMCEDREEEREYMEKEITSDLLKKQTLAIEQNLFLKKKRTEIEESFEIDI